VYTAPRDFTTNQSGLDKLSTTILFTSGYEGLDIDVFLSQLKQNKIEYLIDVREKALSRKKGFSKTKLSESLLAENIIYLHYPDLGSPSELRKKLHTQGDFSSFFKAYSRHLDQQQQPLLEILEITKTANCCLLCFEKDHEKCHRKIIAQEIKQKNRNGMRITHL